MVVGGILFNPVFVEKYVSSDHNLDPKTVTRIYILEGVALVMGILLLISARSFKNHTMAKEKLVVNLCILACSTIFTLALLEVALKFVNAYIMPFNRQRHAFFEYDKVLGWKHRPNKKAHMKNTRIEISSKGIRGDEITYKKPVDEFRILFVGDSQVFGDGVEASDTFPSLLEERFPQVKSINSGVIGYGTDQQLLYVREEGHKYNPDLIVVALNAFDFQDNISDSVRSGYAKPVFKIEENKAIVTNIPVPRFNIIERLNRGLKNQSHIYYFATTGLSGVLNRIKQPEGGRYDTESILPPAQKIDDAIAVTNLILQNMAVEGNRTNAKTLVTFLPYDFDFGDYPNYRKKTEELCKQLDEYGKQNGFLFLDVRAELQKSAHASLFIDTMHFNIEGHKVVTDILGKFLINQNILPNVDKK